MVTVLQALELLYVPSHLPPVFELLVFATFWPITVGVMSKAIWSAYEGRPIASPALVYESIGRVTLLFLVVANIILIAINVAGLILLVIPGIYLWVRLQFVPQILVLEDVGLVQAFRRSWDLVRGSWWRVFGVDVLVFGIATVVNLIAFIVIAAVVAALHLGASGAAVALLVGMSLLWALMDPLVFGLLLFLYLDLRSSGLVTAESPVPVA